MLICNNCNKTFDEENVEIRRESMGECFGTPAYNDVCVCPHCGSDDIGEVRFCKLCDSIVPEYDDYCNDCAEHLQDKFRNLIAKNFTKDELELLDNIYEGTSFTEGIEEVGNG